MDSFRRGFVGAFQSSSELFKQFIHQHENGARAIAPLIYGLKQMGNCI
ncbi:hypothetical protein [cf. Phormidesmis sp. LEGE 11477]|nr:hypothetical protein [cf. Phormidesmis sp. LEGE 11477]MBE9064051.1 hypothetical protein [cf. Phormidesmis sp. LEGE 11477]